MLHNNQCSVAINLINTYQGLNIQSMVSLLNHMEADLGCGFGTVNLS